MSRPLIIYLTLWGMQTPSSQVWFGEPLETNKGSIVWSQPQLQDYMLAEIQQPRNSEQRYNITQLAKLTNESQPKKLATKWLGRYGVCEIRHAYEARERHEML